VGASWLHFGSKMISLVLIYWLWQQPFLYSEACKKNSESQKISGMFILTNGMRDFATARSTE